MTGVVLDTKRCARCREPKELEEFHRSSSRKDGRNPYCKECIRTDYVAKRDRREFIYNYSLLANYGISREEYDAMLEDQEHKCILCFDPFPLTRRPQLDHCHRTGSIRGVLCAKCNVRLSHYEQDPDLLLRYYHYLMQAKMDHEPEVV